MKGRFKKLKYFFLILIAVSQIFGVFPFEEKYQHLESYNSLSTRQILQQTDNWHNLDVLIFFKDSVPLLDEYELFVLKKYQLFPIIRFRFKHESEMDTFVGIYKNRILSIEAIPNSKSTFIADNKDSGQEGTSIESIVESTSANKVHQLGYTGSRVKIGIIDTGISTHEEFGSRIKGQAVFVNQINGYSQDITSTTDEWSHGTHVAGLAAGESSGLAPDAEIYSAKVIHTTSVTGAGGGGGEETTLGILEAIEYLVNNSVDVINISLGQYHNLGTGMRQDLINYASVKHNIVFCVSAGNSGSVYGDRGSLNNPATALQSIAVAASDTSGTFLADFSSKGPKPDYSIKPDITAPGINILGPSNSGSGYVTKSGTSMASPITAGAAALIIDYLKDMNLTYNPGTIKGALLSAAKDMGYQSWRQGAGFLNVSRAIDIIESSPLTSNVPDFLYLHPQELPIDPYEILFPENYLEFNLTVISSIVKEIDVDIPVNLLDLISTPKNSYTLNNSIFIPIKIHIPANYSPQHINASIMVADQELLIKFEIRKPVARLLFDESFNRIAKHGYGTSVYEIQGDASNTIGMYSSFVQYLSYENNYSVTPHVKGELTEEYLSNYDVLVLANPFSLTSDVYMDWVNDPGTKFLSIPADSTQAIYDYVDKGGSLLLISTVGSYCDVSALNEFMSHFDIQMHTYGSEFVVQSSVNSSYNWTESISTIPFIGNYLYTTGLQSSIIATHDSNPTIISHINSNGGRVLLFSSDLTFDNIGFSTYAYRENSEQNRIISFNAIAWLAKGEYKSYFPSNPLTLSDFIVILIIIGSLLVLAVGLLSMKRTW